MHQILFVLQVWRAGEEKNSETLLLICRRCGSPTGKLKCPSDAGEESGESGNPEHCPAALHAALCLAAQSQEVVGPTLGQYCSPQHWEGFSFICIEL